MRNNVITAIAGTSLYIKTDPAFQYDYGLKLKIDGVELPSEYEVHFGNTGETKAKTVTGDADGVLIPDEYLRSGEDIHAWVYLHTEENDGETVYHIQIPVIERHAISEEEITPVERGVIDAALEAMNGLVEQTKANVAHYPYIGNDGTWMVYDAEKEAYADTGVKAQGDKAFDLTIGEVQTLAPGSMATASLTWNGGNVALNLGIPSGEISSPSIIYDTVENVKIAEIMDGANNIALGDLSFRVDARLVGKGEIGPRNVYQLYSQTGINMYHITSSGETYQYRSFSGVPRGVYGGVFHPLTGVLEVDHVLIEKRTSEMDLEEYMPGWKNAGIRELIGDNLSKVYDDQIMNIGTSYGVDTTGDRDYLFLPVSDYGLTQSNWTLRYITVKICVKLKTPIVYQLEPISLATAYGRNKFSCTTGNVVLLRYPCDTKLYIDKKIAETQALVLEG